MNALTAAQINEAHLPVTYENAKAALAECHRVDECKDWSDKAAALAAYAKQAEDDELEKVAMRIRGRAIRRVGELLKEIDSASGAHRKSTGDHTFSRSEAAREVGLSKHQQVQATRVANVPEETFNELVEAEKPATITQLAEAGRKPATKSSPKPESQTLVDLGGRTHKEYNTALHFIGDVETYARELSERDVDHALTCLSENDRIELRRHLGVIDKVHEKISERI